MPFFINLLLHCVHLIQPPISIPLNRVAEGAAVPTVLKQGVSYLTLVRIEVCIVNVFENAQNCSFAEWARWREIQMRLSVIRGLWSPDTFPFPTVQRRARARAMADCDHTFRAAPKRQSTVFSWSCSCFLTECVMVLFCHPITTM